MLDTCVSELLQNIEFGGLYYTRKRNPFSDTNSLFSNLLFSALNLWDIFKRMIFFQKDFNDIKFIISEDFFNYPFKNLPTWLTDWVEIWLFTFLNLNKQI